MWHIGNIGILHCPEPSTRFAKPGSNLTHRLTQNAHQAGYHLSLTHPILVYLKSDTVYPRLMAHTATHNGRLQTFLFAGSHATHTIFLTIYAYQHGYIQPAQCSNTPISLRNEIDKTLRHLYTKYPHIKTIVLGDLQHTINNSHHQRMGPIQPSLKGDLLHLLLKPPHSLQSIISSIHSQHPYHTWNSHSNHGKAGLDHILTTHNAISPANPCGIDQHTIPQLQPSDHFLIYSDIPIKCAPHQHTCTPTLRYQYRAVASAPYTTIDPTRTKTHNVYSIDLIPQGYPPP